MRDLPDPKERFTGLFIPSEILAMEELSPTQCMLLAWIDALYHPDYGGCFATNAYFANKMKLKNDTISKAITHLTRLGLVESFMFENDTRILRACKEKWFKNNNNNSDLSGDVNPTPPRIKILPPLGLKSYPSHITYSKEDKNNTPPNPQGGMSGIDLSSSETAIQPPIPKPVSSKKELHLDCVMLSPEEFTKLLALYGKDILDWLLEELNTYVGSSGKKYASHYHVLQKRGWVYKRYLESKAAVKNGYQRSGKLVIEADKMVQPTEREKFKVTISDAEIRAYEEKAKKARHT